MEEFPTGAFEFSLFGGSIPYSSIVGCRFKFINVSDLSLESRLLLGKKSVLGCVDTIDLDHILLYACVRHLNDLGKVYILEKGLDFVIYSLVPLCEKNTSLYKHYQYACEHEYGQMDDWEFFKTDHYTRHKILA